MHLPAPPAIWSPQLQRSLTTSSDSTTVHPHLASLKFWPIATLGIPRSGSRRRRGRCQRLAARSDRACTIELRATAAPKSTEAPSRTPPPHRPRLRRRAQPLGTSEPANRSRRRCKTGHFGFASGSGNLPIDTDLMVHPRSPHETDQDAKCRRGARLARIRYLVFDSAFCVWVR